MKSKFQLIEPELIQKKSPVEGWRKKDKKLFDAQNFYADIANGSTWHYSLEIASITPLTHDSAAIEFKRVGGLPFKYKAGQYVVVSKMVNHEKVSRCYSICSNPNEGKLTIGIKRVQGGLLSNGLLDTVREGQALSVAGPFGDFGLKENPVKHIFIAGGSGITPILSMLQKALDDGATSLKLIYGCRSAEDVMFKDKLVMLANAHADRFSLKITYDLLDAEKQIQLLAGIEDGTTVYLCGPSPMMDASRQALRALEVADENIISEAFHTDRAILSGETHIVEKGNQSFVAYASETILEASKRNQMTLPHACGMGQCGTCKVKLRSGEVSWNPKAQSVLLDNEINAGYILTCMCHPNSKIELGH